MDFLQNQAPLFKQTEKLEKFVGHAKDFDAIFFVGGHGRKFLPPHPPPLHSTSPSLSSPYPSRSTLT